MPFLITTWVFTVILHERGALIVLVYGVALYPISLGFHKSHAPEDTGHVVVNANYLGFRWDPRVDFLLTLIALNGYLP